MCGNLQFFRNQPTAEQRLARLAFAKGIRGERIPPMRPIPLVVAQDACLVAVWGWPGFDRPLMHCRSESAAVTPTWAKAWREHRGVVPVAGWHEGDRSVEATDAHLAVLWMAAGDEVRFAVLTQDPPAQSQVPRYPVPLTQAGALAWMAGGGLDDQVRELREYGQETIFGA